MANAWTINNTGGTAPPVVQKNAVTVPNVVGVEVIYKYDTTGETATVGDDGERIELWLTIEDPASVTAIMAQPGLSGFTASQAAVRPTPTRYQALASGDTLQFVTVTVTSTGAAAGAQGPI